MTATIEATVEDIRRGLERLRGQGGIPPVATGNRPTADRPEVRIVGHRIELSWDVDYRPQSLTLVQCEREPLNIEVAAILRAAEAELSR